MTHPQIQRRLVAVAFLAGAAIAWSPSYADDKPMGATTRPGPSAATAKPCVRDVQAVIATVYGWRVTLRRVSTSPKGVRVRITVHNAAARNGLLSLSPDPSSKVVLKNASTHEEIPAAIVEGIGKELIQVSRDDSVAVEFEFPDPGSTESYTFESAWVTSEMQGTTRPFRINFPVPFPDRSACGT